MSYPITDQALIDKYRKFYNSTVKKDFINDLSKLTVENLKEYDPFLVERNEEYEKWSHSIEIQSHKTKCGWTLIFEFFVIQKLRKVRLDELIYNPKDYYEVDDDDMFVPDENSEETYEF